MFLGHILLQLSCIYNLCYMYVIFPVKYLLYFYISTFRSMCAVPNMAIFFLQFPDSVLSRYVAQVVSVAFKWFQVPPLLLVSIFFSHSTCTEFLILLSLSLLILLLHRNAQKVFNTEV